ncbi:hypothetical protein LSH36_676g01050 [Paralvinella palmiformis]|uniref:Uncharacterized protein n=1 Tax=Paralvinella palmiformis TaxID=53620 RepID=A0AAD9J4L2_9ANNE|nr:hypothetical protein LSH36_676g01050 [Paralvinella palmiformis]
MNHNLFIRLCLLLSIICLYPVLAFVYILAPTTKIGRMVGAPCIKFVAQATSYLVFLSLILVHGHVEQGKLCGSRMRDYHQFNYSYSEVRENLREQLQDMDMMCVRGHHPAVLEILILLWITGTPHHTYCIYFFIYEHSRGYFRAS